MPGLRPAEKPLDEFRHTPLVTVRQKMALSIAA